MTNVLIGRGKFGHRNIHAERAPCNSGGRDWNDVSISQGVARIAGKYQKLGRGREGWSCRAFSETWLC